MDEIERLKIERRQKKYTQFLRSMNCCPLCSSPLSLIHEVDEQEGTVKETAHCSHCDLETRKKDHPIQ